MAGRKSNTSSPVVAEIMSTELFTLTPDTTIGSAMRLSHKRRVMRFLVIEDGSLAGIICRADMRGIDTNVLIRAHMKSPVLCIGPDTTVSDAIDILDQNEVGCLPVVTGTFLVGIVTRKELGVEDDSPEMPPAHICDTCRSPEDVFLDLTSARLLCGGCRASRSAN